MFDPTESKLADQRWDEELDQMTQELAGQRVADTRDAGDQWDAASEAQAGS